ncbi:MULTISPECIES: MFS transporter [Herbaspirillum]|uniref:MFS transporter n=1 Tax=Herbaspirillum rubrisubalbicans TaxID=80842 RepID=A0AAD0U903_9BURK|nr:MULTISPECIES: MFS transporter [Herbaspirillum]ALU90501.1 permease of the major facilitator superfamily [Herbaspirillum rubrisubalbicans M1]AYR25532.1 MFS transporter [Herbaspirillum rubrisubalbicans]
MWLQETTTSERRTLTATFTGYAVDGFDYMIYTFLIPTLLAAWSMSKAEAGYIATGALLTSAVGGWAAGVLADRYGRVRVLQWTVLWFALFTFLSGFTNSFGQLFFTRAMQGFGMGGEWAVGSVLIAETISARHRGKASGLVQSSWAVGWAASALAFWGIYAVLPPEMAWKVLFWIGILPALLTLYIRRTLHEPEIYLATQARLRQSGQRGNFLRIFHRDLLRTTLLASLLATGMQGAYYSVTTWLPTFLKTERHLSVLGTSTYLLVLIGGSFCGYLTSAWLSDTIGRRRCFMFFAVMGIVLVLSYTQMVITDAWMLALGFVLGFFLSGIFAGMGAYLSELFPSDVRGSGQGFCYNVGRALGAICPALVGYLGNSLPLGQTIGWVAAACYALVILACLALPETRGKELEAAVASA